MAMEMNELLHTTIRDINESRVYQMNNCLSGGKFYVCMHVYLQITLIQRMYRTQITNNKIYNVSYCKSHVVNWFSVLLIFAELLYL